MKIVGDISFAKRKIGQFRRKIEVLEDKIKYYENIIIEAKEYYKNKRLEKKTETGLGEDKYNDSRT